jgi:hypothetical protein
VGSDLSVQCNSAWFAISEPEGVFLAEVSLASYVGRRASFPMGQIGPCSTWAFVVPEDFHESDFVGVLDL